MAWVRLRSSPASKPINFVTRPPEPERKGELWEVMKKNGFEDLFTINSQTLSATVKELIAANEGVRPEWLDGLIKIAEKNSIRVAKSKKY